MNGAGYRLGSLSPRATAVVLGLSGVVLVLAVWQVVAVSLDSALLLPRLQDVLAQLGALVTDPAQRVNLTDTLYRVFVGFLGGSVAGLVLGAAIGSVRVVRELLNPYLNFLRAVTPVAWIVPATIWLGIGTPGILFVVVYAAAFPVAINTISGMAAVPRDKVRMARMFGMNPLGVFARILVPNAVPYIIIGARLSLGFSFMAAVGCEMLIGQTGLGYVIYDARVFYDTAVMYAAILVLGVLGYLGDRVFLALRTIAFSRYYAGRD